VQDITKHPYENLVQVCACIARDNGLRYQNDLATWHYKLRSHSFSCQQHRAFITLPELINWYLLRCGPSSEKNDFHFLAALLKCLAIFHVVPTIKILMYMHDSPLEWSISELLILLRKHFSIAFHKRSRSLYIFQMISLLEQVIKMLWSRGH